MTARSSPLEGLGPAARACLTVGLSDHPVEVDAACFKEEADFLVSEGLAPVALEVTRRLEGIDGATLDRFRRVSLEVQMRSMMATTAARRILEGLDARGVPAVVIKGPAVERFHAKEWPRAYSDVDLLVPDQQYETVISMCKAEGFTVPASTPQWPWMDRQCKEGVNLHSQDGGNIDVHHHLPPWVFGQAVTADAVIAAASEGLIAGTPARFASAEHCLVIASLHVLNDLWKGKLGLPSWRDIVVLLGVVGPDRAVSVFEAVKLGWLLELVTASLAAELPEAGLVAPPSSRRLPLGARVRMSALGWNNDSTLSRHRVSFAARLPTARALAFIGGCIVPQPLYVREYYRNYRSYWRHVVTETISTAHGEDPRMDSVKMTKQIG